MDTPPLIAAAFDERYLIDREIGSGGMAIVYLARDRKLDREVALKVLRPELGAVLGSERFLTEIKISARLDHPHILTLIDSGNADGFLYYVLPYVRGESLRARLDREHQLSIEESVRITKQVASALDYAHRQGLVHRDIKPENILLQEGEAMLTDFGIALAVKEAGGNRLTQTGLSLGTPQYMSPEQATGDRGIDARSDVYSLAAVLYEMLGGEPPVSGASAQSMIAKLMTEKPTHLRILRDSISVPMDEAVAKALSKTPADRFTSAGEFVRALEAAPLGESSKSPASAARRRLVYAAVAAGVAVTAIGAAAALGKFSRNQHAVLGDKTQLTLSGAIRTPAISGDGKQLAYISRHCGPEGCRFSVVVQDVGRSSTRTILERATAGYKLDWSPDRRNMLFFGTINGQLGSWLLSALGAAPRYLGPGISSFYADGDSLLLGPAIRPDSVYWIKVAALDGPVRDSIRVAGPGQGLTSISVVPGTNWILTLIRQPPHGLWQVIGRNGEVADHVVNACTCGGLATKDAVWLARAGEGVGEAIVRIGIDRSNGRLATQQDTMIRALFTGFSLTADGGAMVMDQGTYDYNVWAIEFADLLKGRFPDDRRIAHASTNVGAVVSPDGARLLIYRAIPMSASRVEARYAVMPFAGGQETPLGSTGTPLSASWSDSVTVAASSRIAGHLHFALIDVRTGAQRDAIDLPDSAITDFDAVPGGWIWIPERGDRLVVRQGGRTREFPEPAAYASLSQVATMPSGERVFISGRNATRDSLIVSTIDLRNGSSNHWATMFAERGAVAPLADGTALMIVAEAQANLTLLKLAAPDRMERIWTSPGALHAITVSGDLRRATASTVDYRADAWMSKVVRPQ